MIPARVPAARPAIARVALAGFMAAAAATIPARATAPLPPICAGAAARPGDADPIDVLKERLEAGAPGDPDEAIRLMCVTIPRVEREQGAASPELAWWVASLATPLVAYKDLFDDAVPLLEFAEPILRKAYGRNSAEVADLHVARAWIRMRQGRLTECRAEWQDVVDIRTVTPGEKELELQKALVGLAQAQAGLRDFDGARASLDRAREILRAQGETVSEAAAAIENTLAVLAFREENYPEARRRAEALIDIETRLDSPAAQRVPGLVILGQSLERLDEYEASEAALREAVRLATSDQGPLQRHLLTALSTLGSFLDERGSPQEALDLESRALAVGEATLGPDAPRLVRLLVDRAAARRLLGDLAGALHDYERAGSIVETHAADVERPVLVSYFLGRGTLEAAIGEPEAARAGLRRGLEAAGDEPTLSTDRAAVLAALAQAAEPGDPDRRARLEQALALYRARLPETHPRVLRVLDALCGLEIEADPAEVPDCDAAARRLEEGRLLDPGLRAAVYGRLGDLAARRGDVAGAWRAAVRALAAAAAIGTPDPSWRAAARVADLLRARGDAPRAIGFGKEALAQIERMRGSFTGDDRRLERDFLRDKVAVYRAVADDLFEAGRFDEGLEVQRLLKDEEIEDFTLRAAGRGAGAPGPALTDAERRLCERYAAVVGDAAEAGTIGRLSRLEEAGRLSVREGKELEGRLAGQPAIEAERAARLEVFLAPDTAAPAPSAALVPMRAAALADAQKRLGPDHALAVYLLTGTRLRILIATRKGQSESVQAIDAVGLRRDVGRFLDAIARRAPVEADARSLYDRLARPLDEAARRAGADHLALWLDDALRYVPFAALHDGTGWLGERYAIEVRSGAPAPAGARPAEAAAARTAASGDRGRPESPRVRGLGVTQALAGYAALPAVGDELCAVVRGPIAGLAAPGAACADAATGNGALPGEGFADAAFTRARLDALFSGPRDFSVLHLGTHFALRPGNVLRSWLLLGDGSRLALDDFAGRDFSGIDLLTLSACDSGVAGATGGDGREVEGLSTLVARRGARHVVASLWEVEDRSTAGLMRALYEGLRLAPADVAGALRRAQATVRVAAPTPQRAWAHPYYWAGFVVWDGAP